MSDRRSYHQFCGLARALDAVGERWTLLMVRECLLGPRRYRDFMEHLPGLTTNLLAKRLKEMQALGILEKVVVEDGRGDAYQLSALGMELEPVVMALGKFGENFMRRPPAGDKVNPAWGTISLKRRYRGGLKGCMQLLIDGRPLFLEFQNKYLKIEEREDNEISCRIEGTFIAFQRWWFLGVPVSELLTTGALQLRDPMQFLPQFTDAMDGLG